MGTKADVWMPLYIGDYLADTGHLTTTQHGAYMLMLMHYWRKGPLPNDPGMLAQITRMSLDAWSNAQAVLVSFFTVGDDGMLHQKRIDEEKEGWEAKRQKAKEKAEKAAKVMWSNRAPSIAPSNAPSIPQAMLELCPSPSPSPIYKNYIARFTSSDVEIIYQAYPRKIGRGAALRAIDTALKTIDDPSPVESLLKIVQAYARSPAGNKGEYTPHPATWFKQRRYLDNPKEWER